MSSIDAKPLNIPTPAMFARKLEQPKGCDPDTITFTANLLEHAHHAGFTREQMQMALRDPRWVNVVLNQPKPKNQKRPRYRYCGHGVAVIVENQTAIAVIPDDTHKKQGM